MEETIILQAECECCGLKEDYTKEYITRIRTSFSGKWVCGLCTEAVKERLQRCPIAMEDAIKFVQDFNTTTRVNPKLSMAWMMRDIAKRNCSKRNNLSGGKKIIRTSSCAGRIDYNSNQEH
ncbi:hypothetical protein SASPL_150929 [Salvia splendens]|uniref:DUF1677 domain-containing protein n=2 Tax=Salvia splendens TaxID=180675 RepID=A0A8X8W8C3_SALSN|nr:hypothetical protein SASPL_150929 [Salvia splendens]